MQLSPYRFCRSRIAYIESNLILPLRHLTVLTFWPKPICPPGTAFYNEPCVERDRPTSRMGRNSRTRADAALTGFGLGELITIPSLPDATDWHAYEAARQKLIPNLSRKVADERYRTRDAA